MKGVRAFADWTDGIDNRFVYGCILVGVLLIVLSRITVGALAVVGGVVIALPFILLGLGLLVRGRGS